MAKETTGSQETTKKTTANQGTTKKTTSKASTKKATDKPEEEKKEEEKEMVIYIMDVRVTFLEDVLGMASANPKAHEEFIASKAPDAKSKEEEIESLGAAEVFEKAMTIFQKDEDGKPFFYDYHIKGFFKDACGALRRAPGSKSKKFKSYKKEIDGLVFIVDRKNMIHFDGKIGTCQRPLRCSTPQGERIALTSSESIPAGATMDFTIKCYGNAYNQVIREWLDYGADRGMGQWRNSGAGRFVWDELDENGNVIGGNNVCPDKNRKLKVKRM